MKQWILISAILAAASTNLAVATQAQVVHLNVSAGNVPQQISAIQEKLLLPEYVELTKENQSALNEQFRVLQSTELTANQATNSEKTVNQILDKTYADSKQICIFETALGSNMKKRSCRTVAAKERQYQNTQRSSDINNTSVKATN